MGWWDSFDSGLGDATDFLQGSDSWMPGVNSGGLDFGNLVNSAKGLFGGLDTGGQGFKLPSFSGTNLDSMGGGQGFNLSTPPGMNLPEMGGGQGFTFQDNGNFWNQGGNQGPAPNFNVNPQTPGASNTGLFGEWGENVMKGLKDPKNLAKIMSGVGTGLINQIGAPKPRLPSQAQSYYDTATQAATQQNDFANQQAANYGAYRVPLQRQITSEASFLGTPDDLENFRAKKMADVAAANQGTLERLKRYGQTTGRNLGGEIRRQGQDVARQQVDATNRGLQERKDWALGQQANAARLWEPPNYNPGMFAALGSGYMNAAGQANNMNRQSGMDIGAILGQVLAYDPASAGRNQTATTPQNPTPWRYPNVGLWA